MLSRSRSCHRINFVENTVVYKKALFTRKVERLDSNEEFVKIVCELHAEINKVIHFEFVNVVYTTFFIDLI